MIRSAVRLLCTVCALSACVLCGPAFAAGSRSAHGAFLHLVGGLHATAQTAQSNNWFGYDQGALDPGGSLFHAITASWTVPRATAHRRGQEEASSDWIGIGGGCVNSGCGLSDSTLIQTGTEQDVAANGSGSYSAWWEIIPGPSMPISMTVRPGDRIHASITETVPASNLWRITIQNLTRSKAFTTTVEYSSTQDTAEWIEETPLILGTNAGFAALPQLTSPVFDQATSNGHPAALRSAQKIDLIDSNGSVIAVPSGPDRDQDGFNACTWTRRCRVPGHS